MVKIKIGNKIVKFNWVALYPGVKMIDKEIASENLSLLQSLFDKNGIRFQLAFGTLLGAVRERDFISHDEDIDLALLDEDRDRFIEILPYLESYGFKLCRYDRRDLFSLIRKGEYIDLYFYRRWKDGLMYCSGWINLEKHITNSTVIEFKGNSYNVPENWEEYLIGEYGSDWRTPVKFNNYDIPFYKRKILVIKEFIKYNMPDRLFKYVTKKVEAKMVTKCLTQLSRNLKIKIS